MDGDGEIQQELRRLSDRFYLAVLLDIFTRYCRRESGLEKKTVHSAAFWALEFNLLAHLCFLMVMFGIIRVPVVVERMRRQRPDADVELLLGSICLSISLSLFAYLRWLVVG